MRLRVRRLWWALAAAGCAAWPPGLWASTCAGGYVSVCAAGCTFATISAAVSGIPAAALTGDYCVDVKSNATFAEQVTVQGKNPNNFQIIIGTTTGANTPLVAPSEPRKSAERGLGNGPRVDPSVAAHGGRERIGRRPHRGFPGLTRAKRA